jgi:hypothetical protein
MKKMEVYDGQGGEKVINAYQPKDLEPKLSIFRMAELIWWETWVAQGSIDEGSCCGGKGLEVDFVRPRQRYPRRRNVVGCNFVQGNVAAYKSHGPALEYLKENGIDAKYNDGWMD